MYVLEGGDGDGSEDAPFGDLASALSAVVGRGAPRVVLGEGSYLGALRIDGSLDDLELLGRCPELTVLRSDTPTVLGVEMEREAQSVRIVGLAVADSSFGVDVLEGTVFLENIHLLNLGTTGLYCTSGATVTMSGGEVRGTRVEREGWAHGVSAESGCALTVTGTRFADNTHIAVAVVNATATLSDLRITGTAGARQSAVGVWIDGGQVQAENLDIGDAAGGVGVRMDGGSLALQGSRVHDLSASGPTGGLFMGDGATADIGGLLVERVAGRGVAVSGGELILRSSTVADGAEAEDPSETVALLLVSGSELLAEDLELLRNPSIGLLVSDSAAELQGGAVVGTTLGADTLGVGVLLRDGAQLRAQGFSARENAGYGMCILDGSALLDGVEISENPGFGLVLYEPDSVVDAVNLSLSRNGAPALLMGDGTATGSGWRIAETGAPGAVVAGGTLTLDDFEVTGTRRHPADPTGLGLYAEGEDTLVTLSNGTIQHTEGPGLWSGYGAEVRCTGCVLRANQFAGAGVWEGGELTLTNSRVEGTTPHPNEGGGFGVYLTESSGGDPLNPSRAALRLDGAEIGPHPLAALYANGDVRLELTASELNGSAGTGGGGRPSGQAMMLIDTDAEAVAVTGSRFAGSGQEAIFLHAAGATFSGNTFADNATDLWWQGCAQRPAGTPDAAAEATLCPAFDQSVAAPEFFVNTDQHVAIEP